MQQKYPIQKRQVSWRSQKSVCRHIQGLQVQNTDWLHNFPVKFWFDFCFAALQHILGHFGRGQIT